MPLHPVVDYADLEGITNVLPLRLKQDLIVDYADLKGITSNVPLKIVVDYVCFRNITIS